MGKGKTKTIPKPLLYTASFFGDFIKNFYPRFPLYKERFYSLTTSKPVPLDNTYLHLGPPKVDLYDAMITTINWLESYYADN